MTTTPLAEAIEKDVLDEARRHGIVLWLDPDRVYEGQAGAMAERFRRGAGSIPVVCFRGSFLETMLELAPYGGEGSRRALVLHLPGLPEAVIKDSPLYEYRTMGRVHTVALPRLLREVAQGRALPQAVEAFLRAGSPTPEAAEAWLAEQAAGLRENGLLASTPIDTVADVLLHGREDRLAFVPLEEVAEALQRNLGMDPTWRGWFAAGVQEVPRKTLALQLAGWLMAVEYVHDLTRAAALPQLRRLKDLPAPAVEVCRRVLERLRGDHADVYVRYADRVEAELVDELAAMSAADLGRIDTFRAEEAQVLDEAVACLEKGRFTPAREWAEQRLAARSLWLEREPNRQRAWRLVREAAAFGELIALHRDALSGCRSVDEATGRYRERLFAVDGAHRRFEQERFDGLDPYVPHFAALSRVVEILRERYRAWADELARAFSALCRDKGFLPDDGLRQRTLFDDEVMPLVQTGEKVALFLVDALRFEMAAELHEALAAETGAQAALEARLAELPTVTSVGMNALPPVVEDGRLRPVVERGTVAGFRSGGFTVRGWPDRIRAIATRVGGKVADLKLSAVCDPSDRQAEREAKAARLVVVRAIDIDDAGEADLGLAAFAKILEQLRSAYRHLAALGVQHFVVTADHGFQLLDPTGIVADGFPEAERRHALRPAAYAASDTVAVSMAALGYEGAEGWLHFRADTAVFQKARPGATFVHGGNSLQERVIPVLTVSRGPAARRRKAAKAGWMLKAQVAEAVLGSYRIVLSMTPAEQQLSFAAEEVAVALRCQQRDDVRVVVSYLVGGRLQGERILAKPDAQVEVFFKLEGKAGGRVQVVAEAVDAVAEPVALPDWFDVVKTVMGEAPAAVNPAGWDAEIEDEGIRKVFRHIEAHGVATEEEIARMLGGARQARRFTLAFDDLTRKLPFGVRIEAGEGGKRYVREVM